MVGVSAPSADRDPIIPAIDAHQHFWDTSRVPLPWLRPEHAPIARAFAPGDLEPLLAEAGVEQTILVQSANLDQDTAVMFEHARAHEWIAAVVAWLPLASVGRTEERLTALAGEPKLRGVRHLIHDEADPHWILQPAVLESLRFVEARGLVLELPVVWPRHLSDVPELARMFPALTIVIDHLGKPPIDGPGEEDWARALRTAAAAGPNVTAKISGLNTATARSHWSAGDLERSVRTAFDSFGAQRLMCGSDWPVALLNGDYARVWAETRRVVALVAPDQQRQVLASTARRLYGLSRPDDEADDGTH